MFNECTSSTKVYAECTERDLLDLSFRNNSPNYELNSQFNPFIVRGDNLSVALPQNGISHVNSIVLLNNSEFCIKYEWDDIKAAAAYPIVICVQPKSGFVKPGFTKQFQVSVQSTGANTIIQSFPLKCSVFQYIKENFREYSLPDGYFELTERGYYEKVSKLSMTFIWVIQNIISIDSFAFLYASMQPANWSPASLKFLQSLFVNLNMRILNSREIIKYATTADDWKYEHLMRQCLLSSNNQRLNDIPLSTEVENVMNFTKPKREIYDDECRMMETLIG